MLTLSMAGAVWTFWSYRSRLILMTDLRLSFPSTRSNTTDPLRHCPLSTVMHTVLLRCPNDWTIFEGPGSPVLEIPSSRRAPVRRVPRSADLDSRKIVHASPVTLDSVGFWSR